MRLRLSRPLTDAAGIAGLAAVPFVAVLIMLPGDRAIAADVYVVFLGGLLLLALVRITNAERPRGKRSAFDLAAREQKPAPEQLPELARMERDVVLSTAERFDSPQRIRLLLRDIAELRLAAGHGIDLTLDREEARETLGEDLWELVDPEVDPQSAPRLDLDRLERATAILERV